MEYQCQRCGYKFEAQRQPYACPYCGEIGTAKPTPTAPELLEEVTPKEQKEAEKKEMEKERF
ncbi:MAG: hypothetical protein IB618_00655 [Candidatus Pacearchaeota archaeon]|nr:MAG: hypothetical protein IB618_00655 [Candidatus Pacearchaeota archaeon]